VSDPLQRPGGGEHGLALEAAVAADQVAAAVERVSQSLALTGADAHLAAALAQVQRLAGRVRAAGGAVAEAQMTRRELERVREQLARFQILVRMLLAHRTALAQFGAAPPEAAAYGPAVPGLPAPVCVSLEG
jgi:multidrug resistance efflux pump